MPARTWLRHPPRIIRQTRTCPTGQQRFPSVRAALDSVPSGFHTVVEAAVCELCDGGVHLDRVGPAVSATLYRPNTPQTRRK